MPISDRKYQLIMSDAQNDASQGFDREQAIRDAAIEHEADLDEVQQAREEDADRTREHDSERARLQAIQHEADRSADEAMPRPDGNIPGAAYESEWQRAEKIADREHTRRMEELCEQQGVTVVDVVEEGDRVMKNEMEAKQAAEQQREREAREQGIELSPF